MQRFLHMRYFSCSKAIERATCLFRRGREAIMQDVFLSLGYFCQHEAVLVSVAVRFVGNFPIWIGVRGLGMRRPAGTRGLEYRRGMA